MPLSKAKNRERMKKIRLHKRLTPLMESNPVQPKPIGKGNVIAPWGDLDADGNPIPEYE